jgi:hypothetical protein
MELLYILFRITHSDTFKIGPYAHIGDLQVFSPIIYTLLSPSEKVHCYICFQLSKCLKVIVIKYFFAVLLVGKSHRRIGSEIMQAQY